MKKYLVMSFVVVFQISLFLMLLNKTHPSYINTAVSISLLIIIYVRLNFIIWTTRIDSIFRIKDNLNIQKKETIMFLFFPTFLSFAYQPNGSGETSSHAVINFLILAIIAAVEFFKRIKY